MMGSANVLQYIVNELSIDNPRLQVTTILQDRKETIMLNDILYNRQTIIVMREDIANRVKISH